MRIWTSANLFCTGDIVTYQEIKKQILKHLQESFEDGKTSDDLLILIERIAAEQRKADTLNRAEAYNAKRLGEESIRVILRLLLDV